MWSQRVIIRSELNVETRQPCKMVSLIKSQQKNLSLFRTLLQHHEFNIMSYHSLQNSSDTQLTAGCNFQKALAHLSQESNF